MTPRLVVSDVDGTLVRNDKSLSDANRDAVLKLHAAGIAFSLVSSRPPFGMRMFVAPLRLVAPCAAYNGGTIFHPGGAVLAQTLLAEDAVIDAIAVLEAAGVDIWLFSGASWLVTREDGAYVPRERRTIQTDPTIVPSFDGHRGTVSKIVASSADFDRLAACLDPLRTRLQGRANAARSQPYYIDITPPGVDKGAAVTAIAAHLGIPLAETLVLGDMDNDLPMFRVAGASIAMGNAAAAVKSAATATTDANEADGLAQALTAFSSPA